MKKRILNSLFILLIVNFGFNTSLLTGFFRSGKVGIEHEKRLHKGVARKEETRGETS